MLFFFCSVQSSHSTNHSITPFSCFSCKKKNQTAILFCSSFRAHQPLLLSCRFEFISNQKAPDKRPILITPSFAYLHINHCRLCCFSATAAAAAASPLPLTQNRLCLPTHCDTHYTFSLSSWPHIFSMKLTDIKHFT